MGSGSGGSYSVGTSGSQPYAPTYSVVSVEFNKDIQDPDIYNPKTGYYKNPTATNMEENIKDNCIYFKNTDKKAHGSLTYVMNENGEIIFGKRSNPNNSHGRSPHPTLIVGKNPEVQCAGMIMFKRGKIFSVDNLSGHFRPNIKSLDKVNKVLDNLYQKNPELFAKDSKWRKK